MPGGRDAVDGERKGRRVTMGALTGGGVPGRSGLWVASRASPLAESGQNGGQPAGQHGFPRAGRADHGRVVPSGRGDLQGPLGLVLSFYVGKVQLRTCGIARDPAGAGTRASSPRRWRTQLAHVFHPDRRVRPPANVASAAESAGT